MNALLNRALADPMSRRRLRQAAYGFVIALAAFLRLWNLGYPSKLVFDETYYVKDAWTLWNTGAEKAWPYNANPAFEAGQVFGYQNEPSFVVHPPLGKWIMGLGMAIFGPQNSFSWRISVAILSILSVALIMMVAKILFQTHIWGLMSGFLLAIDGHAIVLGRTGLLDGILMFFVLLGFYFLLRHLQAGFDPDRVSWRQPWLIAVGLSLGAATAVKWSGLYFLATFGLYLAASDFLRRRELWKSAKQALITFVLMVPVALVTYLASWTGWLVTTKGYDRDSNPNPLLALLKYHQDAYNFHVNLHTPHSYASNPLTWLFAIRPTSFFYEGQSYGQNGCESVSGCSSAITALGNPFIWLPAAASVLFLAFLFFTRRTNVALLDKLGGQNSIGGVGGLILLGIAAGYLPWLAFMGRTVFQFYAIAFLPWMILALVYVIRRYLHSRRSEELPGAVRIIGGYLAVTFAASLFFLPIWIGTWTPYWYWLIHMWLPSWI